VWSDRHRRAHKLLRFASTEADGGQDLSRAAELTNDALLRQLYLRHALDEHRHARLFRDRGLALLTECENRKEAPSFFEANWLSPGERGLDDLRVGKDPQDGLLAFLHLSEKAAAGRFCIYQEVLVSDPKTQSVFKDVLQDEAFHMAYTYKQLARVSPSRHGWRLWQARLVRLWKAYLRLMVAVASVIGTALLLLQYFVFLPPFALLAKRAALKEPRGWWPRRSASSPKSQY
jgi:hypothetical protein